MLITAAVLLFLLGLIHTVLGERFLIQPILRRNDLPRLMGDVAFTKRTLRGAWHVTTLTWWSISWILLTLAQPSPLEKAVVLNILATTFLLCGLISAALSRAKHLSWPFFLVIAALCFLAARSAG